MALRELSTNEKLDAVLRYLNNEYSKTFVKPNEDGSIEIGISTQWEHLKTSYDISMGVSFGESAEHINELGLILQYLKEVKHYIYDFESFEVHIRYGIMYEGKVFIEAGGFVGQENSLNQRKAWEDDILKAGITNGVRLNNLTRGLYIVTGLLFLLELIKFVVERLDMVFCH